MGDIARARKVITDSFGKIDSTRWRSILRWLDMKEGKFDNVMASITMPPYDSTGYYFNKGRMYWRMNKSDSMRIYFDSALTLIENDVAENPDNARGHSLLGIVYAGLGQKDKAVSEGEKAIELAPLEKDAWNNFVYFDCMLLIYVMLNEKEKALEMLKTNLTVQNEFGLAHVFIDPDYVPLLDYPGFDKIVEKFGNEYAKSLWQRHIKKSI